MTNLQRIVIIGGGFGGLYATQSLRAAPVQVTLIDRRNFHLFQPLLYQVATGALSPANIAAPLRAILKHQGNAAVLLAEVTGFDVVNRQVILQDGVIQYDTLIVAAGVRYHYFGHDEWAALAPALKTIEDATEIRRRVLLAFEEAEKAQEPATIQALLTFIVIGGGPTGVELAGALGEIAHYTLKDNFRHINPAQAQVILLEGMERILSPYPPALSARAAADLQRLGVTVRTGAVVTAITPEAVTVKVGDEHETIRARTVLWAAGVQGSPLAAKLTTATGAELDRAGRVVVQPDCSVPGHPEIFVIGDLASYSHQTGKPLPGVAQVAMQQGRYVAELLQHRLAGGVLPPFHYHDKGNMATIGRAAAVAEIGRVHLTGLIGWLAWLFIHLLYLVQFESRLLVLIQWGWNYFTRNRAARLITGR